MDFFKYYQDAAYMFNVDEQVFTMALTNITERARVVERLRQFTSAMYEYVIQDGERPDLVAESLYGSASFTWLILLTNNIFSLYDWPLTTDEFNAYIVSRYGSIQNAQTLEPKFYNNQNLAVTQAEYSALVPAQRGGAYIPTYYAATGERIDKLTYDSLLSERRGVILSPYDQDFRDNEYKRRIKVIRQAFIPQVYSTLKTLFK